ncbi:NADH:ubiquinone oxidoreductase subunit NDUFA12 [Parasphingopyxis sp. CP4]|uniref:NADH:ubiquinone oxidoreductase subunit NDUFA12 n=1 Tax=Parasphingopyxis sp. CP4 TaxID=2724527 RepID=UPI0015A0227E|nr:NADH:ubiquinone oxidoreductase subunit NDUFA12 [Parasphingopyxis sp. CP4]QLC21973.1 NADH:ubiquinone oxidoreductase subunit NDUFA12 [Parasphingopyxis sp. CP4]
MRFLKMIFTWWEGATIGTALYSARKGRHVATDDSGNRYYESKKGPRRRWVIYPGGNDASNVPAEWHGWLHQTVEDVPDQSLPPARAWESPYTKNLTGTDEAYRPAGDLEQGGKRAGASGDYEAWSPS